MTDPKNHARLWLLLAAIISAGQIGLIWWYRFVPVVDYPNWLFQARILTDLLQGGATFGQWYAVRWVPVPNATFTLAAAVLAHIVSYEVAGKLLLSISVALFSWGVWFAAGRFGASAQSAVRYVGFPFGLNMFTLNAQNYTLALGMLMWFIGLFLAPSARLTKRRYVLMSAGIALVYFTHGAVFLVLLLVLLVFGLTQSPGTRLGIAGAIAPSALLGIVYMAGSGSPAAGTPEWGWVTVARHVFKPACIFLKSHGVAPLISPGYANAAWLAVLTLLIIVIVVKGFRSSTLHGWMAVAGGILFVAAPVLPEKAFGVVQPGARILMPGLLLVLLSAARTPPHRTWKYLVFGFCTVVFVYNIFLFKRFDDRALGLTAEIERMQLGDSSFYVLAFDWAENAPLSEKLAPSLNGMSFIPGYDLLSRAKPSLIFETGLITMRDSLRGMYPEVTGTRLDEWMASMFSRPQKFKHFDVIYAFGDASYMNKAVTTLTGAGFGSVSAGPGWRILTRTAATGLPEHAKP